MRATGEELPASPVIPHEIKIAKYRGLDDKSSATHTPTSDPGSDLTENHNSISSTPPTSPDRTHSSRRVHLADPVQSFYHHQQLASSVRDLEGVVVTAKAEQAVVVEEWAGMKDVVTKLQVS